MTIPYSSFQNPSQEITKTIENLNYMDFMVKFPIKFSQIFKNISEIPFLYEFTNDNFIQILDLQTNKILGIFLVERFENFDFSKNFDSLKSAYLENFKNSSKTLGSSLIPNCQNTVPLILIFEKEKFRLHSKTLTNKKFKESVLSNTVFNEECSYKKLKENYLIYQARNKVNFIFIENSEHLHSTIKSFVSLIREKDTYTPKTKKFVESEKIQYLRNLIQMIPGISEAIGNSIVSKYPTLDNLLEGLKDKESFCKIKIRDEGIERNISNKIYEKLFKAMNSQDSEEKI